MMHANKPVGAKKGADKSIRDKRGGHWTTRIHLRIQERWKCGIVILHDTLSGA